MTTTTPADHAVPWPAGGSWSLARPFSAGIMGITAISCGDRWTSEIQPFWALPLPAIAGQKIRDVPDRTTVVLVVPGPGPVLGAALLLVGTG